MTSLLDKLDESLIMQDEYLVSFVNDFDRLFITIWTGVQFVLGFGYLTGKFLVESIVGTIYFLLEFGSNITTLVEAFVLQFAELITDVLKSVLLIYYGIFKIIDAFYTTILDLIGLVGYIGTTIVQFTQDGLQLVIKSICALGLIPRLLLGGVELFSDAFLNCCIWTFATLHDFITQLIWSPISAGTLLLKLGFKVAEVLFNLCRTCADTVWNIPFSVHLAIMGLTTIYFVYQKLSIFAVFRSVFNLIRSAPGICGRCGKFVSKRMARYFKVQPSELENGSDEDRADNNLKGMCVICQDSPVQYIAIPCNHVSLCRGCVYKLVKMDNRCPLCRNVVENFTRVYVS